MKPTTRLARALTDTVLRHLLDGGRYHLPGFGIFTLRARPARRIRNPVTKQLMTLPETWEVRFHAAKRLKARVTRSCKRTMVAGTTESQHQPESA